MFSFWRMDTRYKVVIATTYEVDAPSREEAIEKAIEQFTEEIKKALSGIIPITDVMGVEAFEDDEYPFD